MKRIPFSDPYFDEIIRDNPEASCGITRRAIVNELLSNREAFRHPMQIWFSKAQNIALVVMFLIIATLSAYTIASWNVKDKDYKAAIHDIYTADKDTTEANKQKAFKKYGLTK